MVKSAKKITYDELLKKLCTKRQKSKSVPSNLSLPKPTFSYTRLCLADVLCLADLHFQMQIGFDTRLAGANRRVSAHIYQH